MINNNWIIKNNCGLGEYVIRSQQKQEEDKIRDLKLGLKLASIPLFVLDYTLDRYIGEDEKRNLPKIEKYINEFNTKFYNNHLYFWSEKTGTQKTTLASYIAKELMLRKKRCQFILMNSLVKLLSKLKKTEEEELKIESLQNCDFLVIDDAFDINKMTIWKSKYQIPFIDSFLRERMEVFSKATCFTANIDPYCIDEEKFGRFIPDIIKRNIIMKKADLEFIDSINDFEPKDMWEEEKIKIKRCK